MKKQKRVSTTFASNIFFGRTEAFLAEVEEVGWFKNTKWVGNKLAYVPNGTKILAWEMEPD